MVLTAALRVTVTVKPCKQRGDSGAEASMPAWDSSDIWQMSGEKRTEDVSLAPIVVEQYKAGVKSCFLNTY